MSVSLFLRFRTVNGSLSSCRFFDSVSPLHLQRFPFINASSIQFASPNHPSKASVQVFFFASVLVCFKNVSLNYCFPLLILSLILQLSYLLPLVLLAFEFHDIDVSPPTSTQSGTNLFLLNIRFIRIVSIAEMYACKNYSIDS